MEPTRSASLEFGGGEKDVEKAEAPETPTTVDGRHSGELGEPATDTASPSATQTPQHDDPHHNETKSEEGGHNLNLTDTVSTAQGAQMSLPREVLFIATICLAQFMTQASLGQVLNIIHQIGDHYDISNPVELTWLIAGYSLTVGTFILVSGRLGDLFGYKKMFLIGFSWFALWTLVLGLSWWSNHVLFTFARVLQGIGPAIILTNGVAIPGATYPPGLRKAIVFSLFGACAPGGSITGAVFAGVFNLAWWPWTFFSTAITLAIIVVVGFFVIPEPPPSTMSAKNRSLREIFCELDPLGAVTGVTALVLFNFAWNQAPIVGWSKAYIIVTLIIGVLLFPLFFYIEVKVSKAPLIPFSALSTDVNFVLGCIACGWSMFGIWIFYIWQFLQTVKGLDPLLTIAYICPAAISGACASVASGLLLQKLRPAYVMFIAMLSFLTGIILLATCPVDRVYWAQIFVCVIVVPWGMDMSFPAGTLILSNAVAKRHQGIAASLVNTVVNYSISLGLGFAGTIDVNVNNGGKTKTDVLHGYRGAMYMGVGLAGLGVGISIFFLIKDARLQRKLKQRGELPEDLDRR